MFLNTPNDDHPWDLIAAALQSDLSPEEEIDFRQWLKASADNRQLFEKLAAAWKQLDHEDFSLLENVTDVEAWEALQRMIKTRGLVQKKTVRGFFDKKLWMAAAVIILLGAGAGWWYFSGRSTLQTYATAAGEQKTISLADGSVVTLQPETRLRLSGGFNDKDRTVTLLSGTARFDVVHQPAKTFTVEMDAVRIRDIGTSFSIQAKPDSVLVLVTSGKIAVTQKRSGESREIAAGGSICLYTGGTNSGEIRETIIPPLLTDSLHFDNAPLSEVLATLEKRSGRVIRLTDSLMGQKRLTLKLGDESLEEALRLVCASMHLSYKLRSGEYLLEKTDSATRGK